MGGWGGCLRISRSRPRGDASCHVTTPECPRASPVCAAIRIGSSTIPSRFLIDFESIPSRFRVDSESILSRVQNSRAGPQQTLSARPFADICRPTHTGPHMQPARTHRRPAHTAGPQILPARTYCRPARTAGPHTQPA